MNTHDERKASVLTEDGEKRRVREKNKAEEMMARWMCTQVVGLEISDVF